VKRNDLAERLRLAIDQTLNVRSIRTPDLGGAASTSMYTQALIDALRKA
jgi:isocitrate dehydrogenase (NAD+)